MGNKFDFSKYFKTGKRLQIALDNISNIEGFEDYLIIQELSSMLDESYSEAEKVYEDNRHLTEISYHFVDSATNEATQEDYKEELEKGNIYVQWCDGYHESHNYNDTLIINQPDSSLNTFVYINSISLPEEIELQAEDGELCYYNIGSNFLRVLKAVTLLSGVYEANKAGIVSNWNKQHIKIRYGMLYNYINTHVNRLFEQGEENYFIFDKSKNDIRTDLINTFIDEKEIKPVKE